MEYILILPSVPCYGTKPPLDPLHNHNKRTVAPGETLAKPNGCYDCVGDHEKMPVPVSFLSQASFATTLVASTIGTFIALSPPDAAAVDHKRSTAAAAAEDSLSSLGLTSSLFGKLAMAPLSLLSLHTALLALSYPDMPSFFLFPLLRHQGGRRRRRRNDGFNTKLLSWSSPTVIPLAMILMLGIPLRLVPYATLGRNFTFFLSAPDRLITTGVYAYVQHPSYVGLVTLVLGNVMLLGRTDGVMSCWIPPGRHDMLSRLAKWVFGPAGLSILLFAVWTRVVEEEIMLEREFGREWKSWHDRTARFIPGVF
ncbi:putative prenyl cysteine carboxyl methyltransferase [Cladophialophora carrionii]|uniref:Protein-S-isoprenylcysteine O-methyltransferase n=1 Tax=Cladophialophora carrionii TaxID=86049 RepID=A0A1C1CD33_9EURO|nr:putative prenyl cysteine carboxyl methyltransferase [Cladophialophora carrionii]